MCVFLLFSSSHYWLIISLSAAWLGLSMKLRSLLIAECFGHIFYDNLRNSGSQEFEVSAYR